MPRSRNNYRCRTLFIDARTRADLTAHAERCLAIIHAGEALIEQGGEMLAAVGDLAEQQGFTVDELFMGLQARHTGA